MRDAKEIGFGKAQCRICQREALLVNGVCAAKACRDAVQAYRNQVWSMVGAQGDFPAEFWRGYDAAMDKAAQERGR